jgi:hypothetical protein
MTKTQNFFNMKRTPALEAQINMLPCTNSLRKFKILESQLQVMIVATDKFQEAFHIIRIDKKTDVEASSTPLDEIINEEVKTFTKKEYIAYMTQFYNKGNRSSTIPGVSNSGHNFHESTAKAFGILGFVKFLKGYYLIMITQKKKIAKIGQHFIYQIKDMKMVPLFKWVSTMRKEDENKYVDLFKKIKISEGFYFSYTYDLTHTL